ncbi:MAG: capsular polysaccharide synthesis protein [Lactobacillaceae bacterium]|nr:capsular polysaccharide synthesis protein [Lactobacillaceae bacterium]
MNINKSQVFKRFKYAHVLFFAGIQVLLNGFSKKGLEIANLSIENRILGKLRQKYKSEIQAYVKTPEINTAKHSNIVWICWMQGMTNAPAIVNKCYYSINKNLSEKRIILLTNDNYKQYVTFPDYIDRKIKNGTITKTHLSDLIRIELLTKYGGTWIDATVFCSTKNIPSYLLDSDLFMYQELKPSLSGHATRISSWFMTANKNSDILNLTKKLLYCYWKNNSQMVSYFLLHDFIELAIETYPDEWAKVIQCSSSTPHIMQYNIQNISKLININFFQTNCFHKLSYKNKEKNPLFIKAMDTIGGLKSGK